MLIYNQQNTRSVTDLREKTNQLLASVKKSNAPTFIFKGNKPQAALISLSYLQKIKDMIEDYEDALLASELISDPEKGSQTLEEVVKELNIKL